MFGDKEGIATGSWSLTAALQQGQLPELALLKGHEHNLGLVHRLRPDDSSSDEQPLFSSNNSHHSSQQSQPGVRRGSDSVGLGPAALEPSTDSPHRHHDAVPPYTQPPSVRQSSKDSSEPCEEGTCGFQADCSAQYAFDPRRAAHQAADQPDADSHVCRSGGRSRSMEMAHPPPQTVFLANALSVPVCKAGVPGVSGLEALVAACELAAEKEGMHDNSHYYEELVAESPAFATAPAPVLQEHPHPTDAPPPPPTHPTLPIPPSLPLPQIADHIDHHPDDEHDHDLEHAAAEGAHAPHTAWGPGGAADASHRYRRHKSKVFIRPNKVVYLPTTFMEDAFDPGMLPINCELVVEADGHMVTGEKHCVTIKAVPRQGLSTMYCMTNVMKFQQQYLNWQILNWTKLDDHHIKIHLKGPGNGSSSTVPACHGKAGTKGHHDTHTTLHRMGSGGYDEDCDDDHTCGGRHEPGACDIAAAAERRLSSSADGEEDGMRSPRGGEKAVRRSGRCVRMTAQMQEHLEQEREREQHLAQAARHARQLPVPAPIAVPTIATAASLPPLDPGPLSPGCMSGSLKRRSEFGPDLIIDSLHVPPAARISGELAMRDVPPASPRMGAHHRGLPDLPSARSATHSFRVPVMFEGIEGSPLANLYFMPQSASGNSARVQQQNAATNNALRAPFPAVDTTVNVDVPAAAKSRGPYYIVTTDNNTRVAPEHMSAPASTPVSTFPRLPGALSMFDCSFGSPEKPLPVGPPAMGSPPPGVGMLGPSIPVRPPSPRQVRVPPSVDSHFESHIASASHMDVDVLPPGSAPELRMGFADGPGSKCSAFKRFKSETGGAGGAADVVAVREGASRSVPVPPPTPMPAPIPVPPQPAPQADVHLPPPPALHPFSGLGADGLGNINPPVVGHPVLGHPSHALLTQMSHPLHAALCGPAMMQALASHHLHQLGLMARHCAPTCAQLPMQPAAATAADAKPHAPHMALGPSAAALCGSAGAHAHHFCQGM